MPSESCKRLVHSYKITVEIHLANVNKSAVNFAGSLSGKLLASDATCKGCKHVACPFWEQPVCCAML